MFRFYVWTRAIIDVDSEGFAVPYYYAFTRVVKFMDYRDCAPRVKII